jgi:hypothetical protein
MLRANCPTESDEQKLLAVVDAYPARDQCLLVLGLETGLRVGELCRLTVSSVWRDGACLSTLRVSRRHLKGGRGPQARSARSREIPLNQHAQEFLSRLLEERERQGPLWTASPLFPGRDRRRSLSRTQAWRIIRRFFLQAGCDPAKTWSGGSLRRRFVRRFLRQPTLRSRAGASSMPPRSRPRCISAVTRMPSPPRRPFSPWAASAMPAGFPTECRKRRRPRNRPGSVDARLCSGPRGRRCRTCVTCLWIHLAIVVPKITPRAYTAPPHQSTVVLAVPLADDLPPNSPPLLHHHLVHGRSCFPVIEK